MTFLEFVDYFRTAATKLKDIAHTEDDKRFCRANISEILDGIQNKINLNYPVMVLENYQGSVNDRFSDDLRNRRAFAFLIIQKVTEGDYDHEDQVKSDTEQIMFKVLSLVRKDYRARHSVVQNLDLTSINYSPVSNLADGAAGWRCELTLNQPVNKELKYNAADWNS